jgi:hypothetical protein
MRGIWEEAEVTYFKIPYQFMPEESEENYR